MSAVPNTATSQPVSEVRAVAETTVSKSSRRALLGAAAGAAAATVVSAVARPLTADATTDHVSYLNNENDNTIVSARSVERAGFNGSGAGIAVYGFSESSTAVRGQSHAGYGVYGSTRSGDAGVYGFSASNTGVYGKSTSASGVIGRSTSATGVYGFSTSGNAVAGFTTSGEGVNGTSSSGSGVVGINSSTSRPAVQGSNSGGNTGVQGYSGSDNPPPSSPANTGVHGSADKDATAIGVRGASSKGRGGLFTGALANVRLAPSSSATHPSSGQQGDLFVDASSNLWFCKGAATWVKLA
jgi:hypothetical protein